MVGCAAGDGGPPDLRTETTDRLNLRTCPATVDCVVLRTLPVGTELVILDKRQEWYLVEVLDDGNKGWVHSGYTKPTTGTPAAERSSPDGTETLTAAANALRPWLLPISAFMLFGIFGLVMKPDHESDHPLVVVMAGLLLGWLILLNQFGSWLARLLDPYLDIGFLRPLWTVHMGILSEVSYPELVLTLLLCSLLASAVAHRLGNLRTFWEGFGTGFGTLPVVILSGVLVVALLWVVGKIMKLIALVLSYLLIPVLWLLGWVGKLMVWLWDIFLRDLFLLLATPFIWLWETIIAPILTWILIPFQWVWSVILEPLLAFVMPYVKRIMLFVVKTYLIALGMLPVIVLGLAVLEGGRNIVRAESDSKGIFSLGVSYGVVMMNILLLVGLGYFDLLSDPPAVSAVLLAILPVLGTLRLLAVEPPLSPELKRPSYQQKCQAYWATSRCELLVASVIMPAILLLSVIPWEE